MEHTAESLHRGWRVPLRHPLFLAPGKKGREKKHAARANSAVGGMHDYNGALPRVFVENPLRRNVYHPQVPSWKRKVDTR